MNSTLADAPAKPNAAAPAQSDPATAKAAPDKAAADTAAATTAAAEQAVADKAAADKLLADTGAATAAAVVPDKYELKLPDGSKHEATLVERTAADARELGLDQKAAEKLLAQRVKDADALAKSREDALASIKPGGVVWEKRDADWQAASLKDPDLGAGDPAKLDVSIEKVQQALERFGDQELRDDLKASGWGSKPSVLRLLAKIGRAMGEGEQIIGTKGSAERKKSDAEVMFPSMYDDSGKPKNST